MLKKDYRQIPVERKFKTFRTGDKIKIGSIEVEPIHVDHSIPGHTVLLSILVKVRLFTLAM